MTYQEYAIKDATTFPRPGMIFQLKHCKLILQTYTVGHWESETEINNIKNETIQHLF